MRQPESTIREMTPARIGRWAAAIAYGARETVPADFPAGSSADALTAWALLGSSLMEEEAQGGEAQGYSPRGEWSGAGDRGRAQTPWQLDGRYHAAYLDREGRTPESDSAYALGLLADNWRAFDFVADDELRARAAVAAYNASLARVRAAVTSDADPDTTTTPRAGGYSRTVVARANEWSA